jgi:zinc protease
MRARVAIALWALSLAGCASRPRLPLPLPILPLVRTPDDALRSRAPAPETARDWRPPEPTTSTLTNGLTVYITPTPDLPDAQVSIRLVNRRAGEDDLRYAAGIASLTVWLLAAGNTRHPNWASVFGDMVFDTNRDASVLELRVGARELEPALALLADAAIQPTFDAREFDVARRSQMDERADTVLRADSLSYAMAENLLFAGHPYSRPMTGLGPEIRGRSRDSVVAYHRAVWVPGNCALVLAGPVDEASARALVERTFARWSGAAQPPPAPTALANGSLPTRLHLIRRSRTEQTRLLFAWRGPPTSAEDSEAVQIATKILGGMSSSRIVQALRADAGYTYSARARWSAGRLGGMLSISTSVVADETMSAIVRTRLEVARMRDSLVTETELATAKALVRAGFLSGFESPLGAADLAESRFSSGRDSGSSVGFLQAVERVTAEDVRRVMARYFAERDMILVLVGGEDRLAGPLRALGMGPLGIYDFQR